MATNARTCAVRAKGICWATAMAFADNVSAPQTPPIIMPEPSTRTG